MNGSNEEAISFYQVLNVPRDASPDQIKRAYRRLAQAFHPDKQQSEELRQESTSAFEAVHEAYEVLSNPERRRVYDVYGRQGLAAGLEVAAHLSKNLSELRKDWEVFQAKQAAQRIEAEAAPQSHVQIRMSATDAVRDLRGGIFPPRAPTIANAAMSSSVQLSPTDKTVLSLGGNTALVRRPTVTGESVMVGTSAFNFLARWDESVRDAWQLDAAYGLGASQTSLTSIRQLSPHDTGQASVTLSDAGVGLQYVARRALRERWQASLGWVVGPVNAQGMSLTVSHQAEHFTATAKLEVGAVSSMLARCVYRHTETLHVRAVARCGTTGIDVELGLGKRWSDLMSTYVAAVHGIMGTTLKLKVVRAGHALEVPIILNRDFQDWQTMLLAYTLPPLVGYAVNKGIVAPLLRWHAARSAARMEGEVVERLTAAKRSAAGKQEMLAPLTRRQAAAELARGGLVILRAAFGDLTAYRASVAARLHSQSAAGPASSAPPADTGARAHFHFAPAAEAAACSTTRENGSHGQSARRNGGLEVSKSGRPEPWLDVTVALQFLVDEQRLSVPAHVDKANLLGFADLAPGARKTLHVCYLHHRQAYVVEEEEGASLELPSRKASCLNAVEAQLLIELARSDGFLP